MLCKDGKNAILGKRLQKVHTEHHSITYNLHLKKNKKTLQFSFPHNTSKSININYHSITSSLFSQSKTSPICTAKIPGQRRLISCFYAFMPRAITPISGCRRLWENGASCVSWNRGGGGQVVLADCIELWAVCESCSLYYLHQDAENVDIFFYLPFPPPASQSPSLQKKNNNDLMLISFPEVCHIWNSYFIMTTSVGYICTLHM